MTLKHLDTIYKLKSVSQHRVTVDFQNSQVNLYAILHVHVCIHGALILSFMSLRHTVREVP